MIKINKRLHFLLISAFLIGLYVLLWLGRGGWTGFLMMLIGGGIMLLLLILFFVFTCILPKGILLGIHRKRILFLIVVRIATIIWGLMDNGDMDGACHAYSYYINSVCDQQIINFGLGLTLLCSFYVVILIFIIEWFVINRKKKI